jgi:hypothetical protein
MIGERYIYIRNFLPHQPMVTDAIIYSDNKASYRELLRLRAEGSVNPEAEVFWQPKAWEELYDLEEDPYELNNLAGDPAQEDRLLEMRTQLEQWMVEHRDVGLLNESEMMLRSEGSSPYVMGASDTYPVQEILEAANLCGNPDATGSQVRSALEHPDAAIRYWGVMAAHAREEFLLEWTDKITGMLNDPSPTVSISVAHLLSKHGSEEIALPVLAKHLENDQHPTVVLQAAIASRDLGKGAKELIPVIEKIYPAYRGEVWGRYRDWVYPMFIGFAFDQVYLNCGLDLPE